MEFVVQDAQRVQRGGLGAKDEWAEGQRDTAGRPGEIEFGGREITFGADED